MLYTELVIMLYTEIVCQLQLQLHQNGTMLYIFDIHSWLLSTVVAVTTTLLLLLILVMIFNCKCI